MAWLAAAALPVGAWAADTASLLRRSWARSPRPVLPVAPLPRTAAAPEIDGDLSDACWRDATEFAGFVLARPSAGRAALLDESDAVTTLRVTRDAKTLYLAFRCAEPDMTRVRSAARKRDEPLAGDDTIDVYLAADDSDVSYLHISINPDGAIRDAREHFGRTGEQLGWDSAGKFAARRDAKGWSAELALPLAEISADGADDRVLYANFVRRRWAAAVAGEPESVSWTGNAGPDRLGRLMFANTAVKMPALPPLSLGSADSLWELIAVGDKPETFAVRSGLTGQIRESLTTQTEAVAVPGKRVRVEQRWSVGDEGTGYLSLMLTEPEAGPERPIACVQRAVAIPAAAGRIDETLRRLEPMAGEGGEAAAHAGTLRTELAATADAVRRLRDALMARAPGYRSAGEWATMAEQAATRAAPADEAYDRWADDAARRRLLAGTSVDLRPADEPVATALGRLAERAGTFVSPAAGFAGSAERHKADLRGVRLLEAMDRLADAGGVRVEPEDGPARFALEAAEPGGRKPYACPPIYRGAFRLQPRRLQVTRNFDRGDPAVNLRMLLSWEPGVSVLGLPAEPEVLSATDSSGRDLRPTSAPAGSASAAAQTSISGGVCRREWRVPIANPAAGATALRAVKLSAEVAAAGSRDRWEFADVAGPSEPTPLWAGGVFVRPGRCERAADRMSLTVEVDAGEAAFYRNTREGPDLYPAVRLIWYDAEGRVMPVRTDQENLARRVTSHTLIVRLGPDGRMPAPGRLVVEFPRTVIRERVVFDVGDIVLP